MTTIDYYRKKMAYMKVFEMQKQRSVEVVRRTNEWAHGCWDANKDMKESIHNWLNYPRNPAAQWGQGTLHLHLALKLRAQEAQYGDRKHSLVATVLQSEKRH